MGSRFSLESFLTPPQKVEKMFDAVNELVAQKAEMEAREVEEMIAGQYIVRYTSVLSNRFDSTAFKKVMPEIYKAYTKQVSSRRFTISV